MTILIDHDGWLRAVEGGLLIGCAASLLFWANGRIAGISGVLAGLILDRRAGDAGWRWLFLVGLVIGGALYGLIARNPRVPLSAGPLVMLVAGLLVGFGTRLGSGCTSGHGICGLARLSKRSLTATLVFMIFGFLTVLVTHHSGF